MTTTQNADIAGTVYAILTKWKNSSPTLYGPFPNHDAAWNWALAHLDAKDAVIAWDLFMVEAPTMAAPILALLA